VSWLQENATEIVGGLGAVIAGIVTFAWRASRRMAETEAVIQASIKENEQTRREMGELKKEIAELKKELASVNALEVRVAKLEVLTTEALDRLKTIHNLMLEERRST